MLGLLLPTAMAAFPGLEVAGLDDRLRLVVVGDTGAIPILVEAGAEWEGSEVNTMAQREQLRRQIRDEQADAIVAMGDLVYGPSFAQVSPKCRDTDRVAESWLDPALGDFYDGLGPTWLVLGNHDVGHRFYSRARARCLRYYAATTEDLNLPETAYTVDFGLASLMVLDTNRPAGRWPSEAIQARIAAEDGWVIMGGHHVLRTAFNKQSESAVRTWLADTDIQPDLWINGHAHFLQFGVYDGIPALTSGAGSKVRERPECPGPKCVGEQMPLFSRSVFGYAVVDLTPQTMTVRFKDAEGAAIFCWQKNRAGEEQACALEEPAVPEAIPETSVLGSAPLCEASAALTLPDGSVVVADNEVTDAQFRLRSSGGTLTGQLREPFADTDKAEIEDIEALTAVGGEVLMVGSHSRSKKCKTQSERRRLGLGSERVKTNDEEWVVRTSSTEACRDVLFGGASGEDVGRICAAIVAAEQKEDCTGTFNIEGALTDSEGRVWLGLRAPVVAGLGAPMLRLSADFMAQPALSLDAVAWVGPTTGEGIRGLRQDGDMLLGISGSVADSDGPMTLWQAPMAGLVPGARLSAHRIGLLPPSSEGITRVGGDLVVVTDGDEPAESGGVCRVPAGQLRVAAP